ncbi:MAG TPA: hypothetical protein VFQ13_06370 [Anaerolineales bacterium]|nr:hypothetical protein [Anaerolineales bacterium]
MKSLFKASILLGVVMVSFLGCSSSSPANPSPTPSPSQIPTAGLTVLPGQTPTATIEPTPTEGYIPPVRPTSIPTLDPALVPGLLSKAFSVKALESLNRHSLQVITGWQYGFGGGFWQTSCVGYSWLDTNHLLLYPATGQVDLPEGWSPTKFNVARQPLVINLETGHVWLLPVKAPTSPETCNTVEWSSELGILILPEDHDGSSTISTYTFDGRKLASYTGSLLDVSPSGTKILLADSTVIDLRTNKRISLAWPEIYSEGMSFDSYWTSDETRIFRCCYYYANLRTGISYHSQRSDFQDTNDSQREPWGLVYPGGWIQNDTYFLPEWNWLDYGDIRHLPMLDPAKKVAVDARQKAGIPEDWSCTDMDTSPDGKHVWMTGFGDSYLVDLITFEAQYYPRKRYSSVHWSPNGKFAWLYNNDESDETDPYSILSVVDKKLRPLTVAPASEYIHWWHASDDVLIYPSKDDNALLLLDTSTMSFRELPFKVEGGGYDSLVWSPNGERIAFTAEDGSIWLVDYPKLDNLEQLTPPMSNVSELNWSPDGNSIAFISSSDIYIVDTMK